MAGLLPLDMASGFTIRLTLLIASLFVAAYYVYLRALPRPRPGIPYDKDSARRFMGDIPKLIEFLKGSTTGSTDEISSFFVSICQRLNSPLVQMFLGPFTDSVLMLADHREAQDILLRRHGEFDRSPVTSNLFRNFVPNGTVAMQSHETFRTQRRIWQPTMSSEFHRDVAAPHIHAHGLMLMEMWRKKASLAQGHPFAAGLDLRFTTIDIIWHIAVGKPLADLPAHVKFIKNIDSIQDLSPDQDVPAQIPVGPLAKEFTVIRSLLVSFDAVAVSAFPLLYQWVVRQLPWYKRAWATREALMEDAIEERRVEFEKNPTPSAAPTSAMELVVQREQANALKEGKKVDITDDQLKDELFSFLIAGYETTSVTLSWTMLYLAGAQDKQEALRRSLLDEFPDATPTNPPSAHDLAVSRNPWLEATVSEALRVARTTGAVVRVATRDTQILGQHIPKGTQVFIAQHADSYIFEEEFDVPESVRSTGSQAKGQHYHPWPKQGKKDFDPERWLKKEDGKVVYDDNAGPSMPFAAGPRGCFGNKLARFELKMLLALIVLHFRLDPLPAELATAKSTERMTRQPDQSHVRLRPI